MQKKNSRHQIVIGDGLTAAEFAKTTTLASGDRLTIIGPNIQELGRGVAYSKIPTVQSMHLAFLLNSPSESVDPDFGRWVHDNWGSITNRMAGRYPDWLAAGQAYISKGEYAALNAPREFFGDYLCASANRSLDQLVRQGVTVQRVADHATSIDYDATQKQFHVLLESGETLVASCVDIATGGVQPQFLFDADGQYSFSQLYGNEQAIAARVKQGGAVVCLGTNAAMLDTLRLTQSVSSNEKLVFLAVSPSAKLPEPLIPSQPRKRAVVTLKPHYMNAQDLFAALSQQMNELRQQGYRMADMRGPFKTALINAGLESLLSGPNEARKVLGLMERLFLRGTRDSLADFQSLQDKGQVRLVAGRLDDLKIGTDRLSLTIAHSNGTKETLCATALVNCSGAGKAPRFDTMTETLLEKGWLSRCAVSGGLEVGEGLKAGPEGLRYLSPAVTVIGERALAFSLYDASELRAAVKAASTLFSQV